MSNFENRNPQQNQPNHNPAMGTNGTDESNGAGPNIDSSNNSGPKQGSSAQMPGGVLGGGYQFINK